MVKAQTVREVIEQVIVGTATEREKAVALHDYVRENVKFGFSKYIDAAKPDYTLACGLGSCNSKSQLMVALFRVAGLEGYQHFVVIPKEIMKGAVRKSHYWMLPAGMSHSYVEVKVEGIWCAIDSYIVDTALLRAAQAKLAKEGRSLGYGVRANSTNVWDGQSNAFSQFDQGMMIEDHGRIDNLEVFFHTRKYRNKFLGLSFNTIEKLMGNSNIAASNSYIESIRMSLIN